jgi:hypothetical protein
MSGASRKVFVALHHTMFSSFGGYRNGCLEGYAFFLAVVGVLNSNILRLDIRQHDLETKIVIRGSRHIFLCVESLSYKHACNCDILMIDSKITYFFPS